MSYLSTNDLIECNPIVPPNFLRGFGTIYCDISNGLPFWDIPGTLSHIPLINTGPTGPPGINFIDFQFVGQNNNAVALAPNTDTVLGNYQVLKASPFMNAVSGIYTVPAGGTGVYLVSGATQAQGGGGVATDTFNCGIQVNGSNIMQQSVYQGYQVNAIDNASASGCFFFTAGDTIDFFGNPQAGSGCDVQFTIFSVARLS